MHEMQFPFIQNDKNHSAKLISSFKSIYQCMLSDILNGIPWEINASRRFFYLQKIKSFIVLHLLFILGHVYCSFMFDS